MGKVGDMVVKVARNQGDIAPRDFAEVVKDIKLAILQSRARAAHISNVEALKLYFYVGGYVSKKTRTAKWGSGAIDALANRLQVELPGLRGFSASSIKIMRIYYEAWQDECQIRQTASAESVSKGRFEFYLSALDELMKKPEENPSIRFLFPSPTAPSPRSSKVSAANSPTGSRNVPRRKLHVMTDKRTMSQKS